MPFLSHTNWSDKALSLWAKTGKEDGEWLCLPHHLTDSALVGRHVWNTWVSAGVRRQIQNSLNLTVEEAEIFVSWVCGMHDVGKASVPFASQLFESKTHSHLCDQISGAGFPIKKTIRDVWWPHSVESRLAWADFAETHYGFSKRNAIFIGDIFGAHHGLPATSDFSDKATKLRKEPRNGKWLEVQEELIQGIIDFTGADEVLKKLSTQKNPLPSDTRMVLTGVVIMADWIASNADFFPLVGDAPVNYQERFSQGIESLNLNTSWTPQSFREVSPQQAYAQSFGWNQHITPRPMQEKVFEVAQNLEGSSLICIEAPMGNGKTEAALLAAEILAEKTGRNGVFFGAPTMATSDSLFSRTKKWAENSKSETASMYLGHSKNSLNSDFGSMPRRSQMRVAPEGTPDNQNCAHHTEVIAHQWLWGRKKGILSDIVVGTVDQVLMLALQSKHAMLRHLGLANKVVIIDEIHSYDAYMSSYTSVALRWLARYGVPVVLLSATLPHSVKEELLGAYQQGLAGSMKTKKEIPSTGLDYPVITSVSPAGIEITKVPDSSTPQTFSTQAMDDGEAQLREKIQLLEDGGGCLLILCNTVTRAQEAYKIAQEIAGDDVVLLHARFTAVERVAQEQKLVRELGPEARRETDRPYRRVVVATQVVEQSLDVDFDCIITDIAPVDLLLQRMGRVHRHRRPESDRPVWARKPQVFVRGMEEIGAPTQPPVFSQGVDTVYESALLLPTCAEMKLYEEHEPETLTLPLDIPRLVQAVYTSPTVPQLWQNDYLQAFAEMESQREDSRKRASSYQFPSPFKVSPFENLWQGEKQDPSEEEGFAQVRDTDPTIEVVLTQVAGDGYYRPLPWLDSNLSEQAIARGNVPEHSVARLLATSTVRLPYQFSKYPDTLDVVLTELEQNTDLAWEQSPLLKGQLQLTLNDNLQATLHNYALRYSKELGLELLTPTPNRKEQK